MMKKRLVKPAAAFALPSAILFAMALLGSCANPVSPRPKADIPAGKGVVRVETGAGAERTVVPTVNFARYEYWFAKDGGTAEEKIAVSGVFELDAGTYTVTVKAFVAAEDASPATEGASESFTITAGGDAGSVRVVLTPVLGTGTGTLSFALTWPYTAALDSFTLTRVGGADTIDLKTLGTEESLGDLATLSGAATGIGAGYWLARASLHNGDVYAGKSEVAHIYTDLTTALDWSFGEENFAAIPVTSAADTGPGTLREALERANAGYGGKIFIDLPEGSTVITLTSGLPAIVTDLVIEGNGATLTQSGFLPNGVDTLMRINNANSTVAIRRLHFKGGVTSNYGAAIAAGLNGGDLTLESCIFSDNHVTMGGSAYGGAYYGAGGAVYCSGRLTVRGCTFYRNTAGDNAPGGALYASAALALTGNLFCENVGSTVVSGSPVASGGGNVSDQNSAQSGWSVSSDSYASAGLLISSASFRPLADSVALNRFPAALPDGYPSTDFYGVAITTGAASGAAQTPAMTGYYLEYGGATDAGTVRVDPVPSADGIYPANTVVTLTPEPADGWVFSSWTIDGAPGGADKPLSLAMGAHKTVRAIFTQDVTVSDEAGLRSALGQQGDGDIIRFGADISLAAALPDITTTITIEGNGHILSGSGSVRLLFINASGAWLTVRRLHFKNGSSLYGGGAIWSNQGDVTLESCILSDNRASAGNGGAIYNNGGYFDVMGCTFYHNSAESSGGAVYSSTYGFVSFTGNVFFGNTASNAGNVASGGNVTSGGYNVSDTGGSAYTLRQGDVENVTLPAIAPASFKPPLDSAALGRLPAALPYGYPMVDFYGATIPADGASGAAQTTAAGYCLDYGAAGLGVATPSLLPGADGVYASNATVELTATPAATGALFSGWTINGAPGGSANPLSIAMGASKTVRAIFVRPFTIIDEASLRAALEDQADGDILNFNSGATITLSNSLPDIAKSIVIEGNGATLTQNGGVTASLLSIAGEVEVTISRLHIKGGRASSYGGGISVSPGVRLVLKSCVFSDNQSGGGGAIYVNSNDTSVRKSLLTVFGCTFFANNGGDGNGGAILLNYAGVTLTGNIFLQNTGSLESSGTMIRPLNSSVTNGGYNVSDKTSGNNGLNDSGYTFTTGDEGDVALSIAPASFKPPLDSAALSRLPAVLPDGYPTVDFYGATISAGGASGAVQTTASGYCLDYGAIGLGGVTSSPAPGADGVYASSATVTLTAAHETGGVFSHWTINGSDAGAANPLSITMDASKTVRAIFLQDVTVNDEAGLRAALNAQGNGDTIRFGADISLAAFLPTITKSITIEGNGHILTRTFAGDVSSLLRLNGGYGTSVTVSVRRLHFKDGLHLSGGAIENNIGVNLVLESCIFSGNQQTGTGGSYGGGAIFNVGGVLTVKGCTFYNNTAKNIGGAINGGVTLTGNLFIGNTASTAGHAVYGNATSNGYNVSDMANGAISNTSAANRLTASGYAFVGTDVGSAADLTFDTTTFKPSAAATNLKTLTTLPADFPATYFDGTARETTNATAGAVGAD